jgi:D-3-phosphoglycerate dehydrogenase
VLGNRFSSRLPNPIQPCQDGAQTDSIHVRAGKFAMKVLIADKFSDEHVRRLAAMGCNVTYEPNVKAESLASLIEPYEVLIVRGKAVTADVIDASTQLSLILRAGAGVNTIDVKAASRRGVYVTNCPGKNSIAVAELTFALLLSIDRRMCENVASLRAHQWNKKEFSQADGVFGKTLGIVGLGSIGKEVIIRAKAFGLNVIAWSRSLTREEAEELEIEQCVELDELFRRADIVSLHVALKPETKGLVSKERIGFMKPGAILLNTARGEVVDQAALHEAVAAGKIRAGLDVFDGEPAESAATYADPIVDLPGIYGTHHIGASTEQAQSAIAEEALRIIEHYRNTGEVLNCVNLAKKTPAKFQLVVRHYDRVGVLAFVMDQIRRAEINVEEVHNIIFEGAEAASCRIQLKTEPPAELLAAIKLGNDNIIDLELIKLGDAT